MANQCLLSILNSNYRFQDTVLFEKYNESSSSKNSFLLSVDQFDQRSQKITLAEDKKYAPAVFIKQ